MFFFLRLLAQKKNGENYLDAKTSFCRGGYHPPASVEFGLPTPKQISDPFTWGRMISSLT
jgi:hypothetical protein